MRRWAVWFFKRYTVTMGVVTVLLYAAAIPLTIWLFPATTIILSVEILFGGFTSSMSALGAALIAADTKTEVTDRRST